MLDWEGRAVDLVAVAKAPETVAGLATAKGADLAEAARAEVETDSAEEWAEVDAEEPGV